MAQFRITRAEIPIVFVSSSTYLRKRIFTDPGHASIFRTVLFDYQRRGDYRLDAFCIMPDHYHMVIQLLKDRSLTQVIHALHSLFCERMKRFRGVRMKERIWSRRTWDVWIWDDWMYWQKIAYVLLNPWRAGLVKDPLDDYPYSDIRKWKMERGEEFLLDLFGTYGREGE